MKKFKILTAMIITIFVVLMISSINVYADTVIKEMTEDSNYKYINWGVIASNPKVTNKQVDNFATSAFNRITGGHSQLITENSLAKSQNTYCVEPERNFVAGPYSKGNGGVQLGSYAENPELGWVYSSRIK